MTVLTVANPFFKMGDPSGTGSEGVAAALDRAIVERGWSSLVVAAEGSKPAGQLVAALPADPGTSPDLERAIAMLRPRLLEAAAAADIIHFHGIGFASYLPIPKARVVVTVHAARSYYTDAALAMPNVQYIAVSRHQAGTLPRIPGLRVIPNGVDVRFFRPRAVDREGLVFVGRICSYKGVDIALRVAHALDLPLTIAGPLPRFGVFEDYFRSSVQPLLDEKRRYIGPISQEQKLRLLQGARCVLVPSHGPFWQETSCLVAMEAISCGVPVVGFREGALPETVEHGVTGVIAGSIEEMVRGVKMAMDLSPAVCRPRAELRFDSRRMAAEYLACYRMAAGVPGAGGFGCYTDRAHA
jgi:glycosyltransferase involved in cell wall biosynthesis